MQRAFLRRQSRVVGLGFHPIFGQPHSHAFCCLARLAINDAAFFGPRAQKIEQLFVGLVFGQHPICQVRAIEAGDIATRVAQFQKGDDIFAHALGSGGGQRHHWRLWKKRPQFGKLAVFGPEIVAPLADAVRLVNGQQVYVPPLQIGQETGKHQPLRRYVEQAILPVMQPAQSQAGFTCRQRRVEEGGWHAAGLERIHLVLHQGDQRRHHHREARAGHGRQLEAERFTAACRQQRKHVLAGQRIADDFLLQRSKGSEAKELLQRRQELVFCAHSPG